jgi:hypothetical protein
MKKRNKNSAFGIGDADMAWQEGGETKIAKVFAFLFSTCRIVQI